MSDNQKIFDEVDYHQHVCESCGASFACCCPDPDEETHVALCSECFEDVGED